MMFLVNHRRGKPLHQAPRYLLRDRDGIFGQTFLDQVTAMGMSEVLSMPGAPWHRAYIERVIGTSSVNAWIT